MQVTAMKVGELAKQTGVSVRTLHYYDEIGLLSPSQRTDAEHRLYTHDEIVRLQQIMSLRQLGFSLEEIRACLERPEYSLPHVIQLHMARVREQVELSQKLLSRLEAIAARLSSAAPVTIEDLMQTIEVIRMFETYYTPEQLETLKQRQDRLGEDRIRQVEGDWQDLMAQVRTEMERGADPASESVQALAQRWMDLIQEFTGGDAGIAQSLNTMYQQEGPEAASQGVVTDPEATAMWDYMGRAIAILQGAPDAE